MTNDQLDELERLAAQATPGPWKHRTISKTATVVLAADTPLCATKYSVNKDHDASYIVAACNAVPSLIARVLELERQRDWLIHYAWIDTNAPCPYEMGHFDQKKICPCWTPYHDWENAEDMSRDDWHDLLMEGVITEEDKVNCATDFCECLLAAAEQAAKEAGE